MFRLGEEVYIIWQTNPYLDFCTKLILRLAIDHFQQFVFSPGRQYLKKKKIIKKSVSSYGKQDWVTFGLAENPAWPHGFSHWVSAASAASSRPVRSQQDVYVVYGQKVNHGCVWPSCKTVTVGGMWGEVLPPCVIRAVIKALFQARKCIGYIVHFYQLQVLLFLMLGFFRNLANPL